MSLDRIAIRGARVHNLRDLDLDLPRFSLIVMTGPSGSGKSSLAFDTLYAEGQRRYVESLSAYARQFLEQMERPEVEVIEGLSPAIAIDQKTTSRNPRSTVGTVTEIYDFLRLLYARVGTAHCPRCDRPVTSQTARQICAQVMSLPEGSRIQVLGPIVRGRKGEYRAEQVRLARSGFARARIDGRVRELGEPVELDRNVQHDIEVVVDRVVVRKAIEERLLEAVETGLRLGDGFLIVNVVGEGDRLYSERLACAHCGISVPDLEPRSFSFNSPRGACSACAGLGTRATFDPARVIPDPDLSLDGGAIAPWRGKAYPRRFLRALARQLGVKPGAAWKKLPEAARRAVLYGTEDGEPVRTRHRGAGLDAHLGRGFTGVLAALEEIHRNAESPAVRQRLQAYLSTSPCDRCNGDRLKPSSLAVRLGGRNITDLTRRTIDEMVDEIDVLEYPERLRPVAEPLLREVRERLRFLRQVGLGYLSLDRPAQSLAGGESQRIRLATQIGTRLRGVLYVLDEPSIGLHARDNRRLIDALMAIRDLGNTVVVVEHDEETIRSADWVVDLGPGAGEHGGWLVAEGPPDAIEVHPDSITGAYLSGRREIPVPQARRRPLLRADDGPTRLTLVGARHHNLRGIDVSFDIGCLNVITGVSGSGKSSLVEDTLYRELANRLDGAAARAGDHDRIDGVEAIDKVIDITQAPIGRTPRSNPATYTGAFTPIREIFAALPESKVRGYGAGRFSFNVAGGRCEDCKGGGVKKIEMHFLPDVYVTCDGCAGRRYNAETLEVRFAGASIADVLDMTVEQALEHFVNVPRIARKLISLRDVGLDYLRLGQQATTLSGGEAQRLKLARELARRATGSTLYILDEPTTGLHFEDVRRLLEVLYVLVDQGNTIIVIEHNLEVIKCADRIVDLGPEGGSGGGAVVAAGTPEQVAAVDASYTGKCLRKVLSVGSGRQEAARQGGSVTGVESEVAGTTDTTTP